MCVCVCELYRHARVYIYSALARRQNGPSSVPRKKKPPALALALCVINYRLVLCASGRLHMCMFRLFLRVQSLDHLFTV